MLDQSGLAILEAMVSGALGEPLMWPGAGSANSVAGVPPLPLPESGWSEVALEDAEGVPLATLRSDGSLHLLRPFEHGPFRALRTPARELAARATVMGRRWAAVVTDLPLLDAELTQVAAWAAADRGASDQGARDRGAPVLLLSVAGPGRRVPLGALVRAHRSAAAELTARGVDVTQALLEWPAVASPEIDRALLAQIAAHYGAGELLVGLGTAPVAGLRLPPAPAAVVAALAPVLAGPAARGAVILLTGLSGSGKSTLARGLAEFLDEDGRRRVSLLDGDVVRRELSAGLGFSTDDRNRNVRRIGWVGAEIARHGGTAVCCPIAPYAATRGQVRTMTNEAGALFVLVHVSTPLAECERRDRKGLYARARAGEIPLFTGISDPYEEPADADLAVDTTDITIDEGVDRIVALLVRRGLLEDS